MSLNKKFECILKYSILSCYYLIKFNVDYSSGKCKKYYTNNLINKMFYIV